MIYLKWGFLKLFELIILFPTLLVMPQIIAAFTREMPNNLHSYSWGWLWGTFDNPPQGDEGFVSKRAFFLNTTTGFKGYINRVQWMWRNKLYGFNKLASLKWDAAAQLTYVGNSDISDKYKRPGWYFAKLIKDSRLIGFEFYCVLPWLENQKPVSIFGKELFTIKPKDLRCRLGWKMMTDKFKRDGFAPLVGTCNPFDGYGDDR